MITVVVALIFQDNKVLLAQRATGDSNVFGKWEFPGGKVELNEDEMYAVKREIKEEFELNIKANKFITNNICTCPNKIVDLKLYECVYICGKFKLHYHFEYRWVELKELLSYDLASVDIPLAEYIINLKNKFIL